MARIDFVWPLLIICLVCTKAGAADSSTATKPDPLPRYKLSVGQELIYRLQGYETSATFYVTRSNAGGGWHLFELSRQPEALKKGTTRPFAPTLDCEFDLTPDGKTDDKPADTNDALRFLPMLPPDAATGDWKANGPQKEIIRFRSLPSTQPAVLNFEGDIDGPIQRYLKSHPTRQIRFDLAKGLPIRIEEQYGPAAPGKGRLRVFELVENKIHPAPWAKQIDDEASAVMRAHSEYWEAIRAARSAVDDQHVADGYAAALRILKDARSHLTVAIFRDVMDTYIDRHPIYAVINHGPGPESLVGHTAPSWEFPDLKGQRHALADYHGKILVLDFWYRNCPACIVAMPDMVKTAERYAGKPVAFLGMSVDADPKDAQFMADQQHLPYPTLVTRTFARHTDPTTEPAARRATIKDLYGVNAYPTVIVIGPDGIVRHVFEGGPTEEKLAAEIDPLLPRER